MKAILDSRLRLPEAEVPPDVLARIKDRCTYANPAFSRKRAMRLSTYNTPPTITTLGRMKDRLGAYWITVPRGAAQDVLDFFVDAKVDVELRTSQTTGARASLNEFGGLTRPLRPHQVEIVRRAVEAKQGLIRSGTGSGKTTAMIALANELAIPTLVVVHSAALAQQWVEQVTLNLGIPKSRIGFIGGGKYDLRPITIAIQKSLVLALAKPRLREQLTSHFGAVIADEVHMFAAKTFVACIDPFPAQYRIGVSADQRRKDGMHFLIADMFGDQLVEVLHADLVDAGIVQPVEVRVLESTFECPEYRSGGILFTQLTQRMAQDEERESLIMPHLISETKSGAQCFVLVHERDHARAIASRIASYGVTVGLLLGGPSSKEEFETTLTRIREGTIQVGVGTYKAIGTGIDAPSVSVGFAVTPIANNEQFFGQVRGRFCRRYPGRDHGRLYMVVDPCIYGDRDHKNIRRFNDRNLVYVGNGKWKDL